MEHDVEPILTLPADVFPLELAEWIGAQAKGPLLVSIERLASGQWVLQALPEVDPMFVARVRRILAQHDDVIRRLT